MAPQRVVPIIADEEVTDQTAEQTANQIFANQPAEQMANQTEEPPAEEPLANISANETQEGGRRKTPRKKSKGRASRKA